MDYEDGPMSSSPILDHHSLALSTASTSAPSTPHLASTSEAFNFFPTKPMSSAVASLPPLTTHTLTRQPGALEQMHSDAFGDLRTAVSEAGEGFVRRMREFEASRSTRGPRLHGPSPPSSSHSHIGRTDRRSSPLYTRGRKRPSPTSASCPSTAGIWVPVSAGVDDGDDSDVEIRSSCVSASDASNAGWSPSKKRAVSLSALSAKNNASAASLPYPMPLRSRDRSSSPVCSSYSSASDNDEDDGPSTKFGNRQRSRLPHRRAPRFVANHTFSPAKHSSSPPPLSFSFPTSNNSSRMSLPLGPSASPKSSSASVSRPSSMTGIEYGMTSNAPHRSSKKTERAVAALSLALANGAGSVSDYEALRDAKDVLSLDYSEAGSMWD